MKKRWFVAVALVLAIAVAGLVGCSPEGGTVASVPSGLKLNLSSQQEGISVGGSGKVNAVPDTAVLRLGIEAQESSVALAQEKANGAMNAAMSALDDNGIAEKDIQTQYFNIRKVTRWDEKQGKEMVIGYRVTNMVTAKIREMDKVGAIIDAVAGVGGDLTRIDSIGSHTRSEYTFTLQSHLSATLRPVTWTLWSLVRVGIIRTRGQDCINKNSALQPLNWKTVPNLCGNSGKER